MLERSFRKYAGAGNDFIIIDAFREPLAIGENALKLLVQKACNRSQEGIGSDGLILIEPSASAAFEMRFFNPDGSFGALCGNGARCAVQAAKDARIVAGETTSFEVLGAVNHAHLLEDEYIRVQFQDPRMFKLNFKIRIGKKDFITTNYVDLGSQHAVTFFEDLAPYTTKSIEDFEINRFGPLIRWQPDFQPLGVNANFAEIQSDAEGEYIRIRTFERGVEGETLACGTGCMSTAIAAYGLKKVDALPVRLKTQSGEFVKVNFQMGSNEVRNLSLEGSAMRGIEGTISYDVARGTFNFALK